MGQLAKTQKKMGKKPNYPQRKSKDPEYYNYNSPYYTPLYGTKDCNYTGKKRGRKKDSEKVIIKMEKKEGNFVLYFD